MAQRYRSASLRILLLVGLITVVLVSCTSAVRSTATKPPTAPPPVSATPSSIPTVAMLTATLAPETAPTLPAPPTGVASASPHMEPTPTVTASPTVTRWSTDPHPLQIAVMRQRAYPGSPITFEQALEPEENYSWYIVSYDSDGYKIYALMTIPDGAKPDTGWPVILFNHGYVTPSWYSTTGNYAPYMDMLASNGYIVFKSDYRAHGRSAGDVAIGGGYGSPDYTVDVLNAVASLKGYPDADPHRIGMWGHSMGGQITLRAMVVSSDIKAGVIWGGVVPPYPDIIARWDSTRNSDLSPETTPSRVATPQSSAGNWHQTFGSWVDAFTAQYGEPDENPAFWATISPNTYLADLSGPIQLHHSIDDEKVPVAWSETLVDEFQTRGIPAYEFYTYPNDNHDIVVNYGVAMRRTVDFFNTYVKGP